MVVSMLGIPCLAHWNTATPERCCFPVQVLNKPLDGLAAAAGGLAAAVRGSPGSAARKDRKLCGARPEGVKGRTVPWESPFGGSSASPEVSWVRNLMC